MIYNLAFAISDLIQHSINREQFFKTQNTQT